MYTAYWQLAVRPFGPQADAGFYYPSEVHQGALLKLRYALADGAGGGAVLVGPAGTGKSLLAQRLFHLHDDLGPAVFLLFPQLAPHELLAYLAMKLDGGDAPRGNAAALARIEQALRQLADDRRRPVLVIDDAHTLDDADALETLRLLLNFTAEETPLANLLLVGQPPLLSALDRRPDLEQRLALRCLVRPLRADETAAYIEHRLRAAQAPRSLFDSSALQAVHELTQGAPRLINRLCDLCLLVGFAEELPHISARHVDDVAAELLAGHRA